MRDTYRLIHDADHDVRENTELEEVPEFDPEVKSF
jgi:hypothetical protein